MKYALIFLLGLALAGCAGNDELPDVAADTGEQQIYEDAQRYLRQSNYDLAVRSLQLLESRYPFGKYAEQAQLELIYAHYNAYEHEAAVEAADRFIRLHPQHPSVDYAYYMKGLSAYTGNEDLLFTPHTNQALICLFLPSHILSPSHSSSFPPSLPLSPSLSFSLPIPSLP